MLSGNDLIDRMLNPVRDALAGDAARRLLELRPDPDVQAQLAAYADLANDGRLTQEQRADYDFALTVGTVVSLLQAKARTTLSIASSSSAA